MELSLDMNKRYTYADYLTWLDDKSRELIHGFIKMMSPAPRIAHARVSHRISIYLGKTNLSMFLFYRKMVNMMSWWQLGVRQGYR